MNLSGLLFGLSHTNFLLRLLERLDPDDPLHRNTFVYVTLGDLFLYGLAHGFQW